MAYPNNYARRVIAPGIHRPGFAAGTYRHAYNYRPYGRVASYGRQPIARRWGAFANFGNRYAHGYAGRYTPGYASRYTNRFAPGYRYGNRWNWLRRGTGYGYVPPQTYAYGYPQQPGVDTSQVQAPQVAAPQAAQALPPQWIAWAQSCLAQVVGSWVPQDGIMSKATRHAIKKFQQQQQLPPTGMLDAATVTALQTACSPQAAPAPSQAAPPPPPPAAPAPPAGDDVAAATAAASAGAPPADAAAGGAPPADPSAGAAPDAPAGEFYLGRGGRWRQRRRWGSGFNFASYAPQPDTSDDDSELFMGYGRGGGHFHRRWGGGGGGMGYQQPPQQDDDGDSGNYGGGNYFPHRHRW